MTTPRDLLIVALDAVDTHPVERGDLSLALAAAEAIDLLDAQAVGVEDGLVMPGPQPATGDRLLDEAAASMVRQEPYERIGDWLWRRGRDLSTHYLAALEADGQLVRERHRRWVVFHSSELVLADSSARYRAADRLAEDEPVFTALTAATGIRDQPADDVPRPAGRAARSVLAALQDALGELATERRRRAGRRAEAAADNVQRGY